MNCKIKFLCFFPRSRLFLLLFVFSLTTLGSSYLQKSFAFSAATFTVTNTNDSGEGSLRQAVLNANSNPGIDNINFSITSGFRSIKPLSALPTITEAVVIDGTTQPGYNQIPIIEIDGSNAGFASGLSVSGGNCVIKGLIINRFVGDTQETGNGIFLGGFGGNQVIGNFIGTDSTGTVGFNTQRWGILVDSNNNQIGGTAPAERNVISGNSDTGIYLRGFSGLTQGNLVRGNHIGTDLTGTQPLGNNNGIQITAAQQNIIGGMEPGAGNLIAHNRGKGIFVESGAGHKFYSNSIFSNAQLGIGFNTGSFPNSNDQCDSDTGSNWNQNHPVLSYISSNETLTRINGRLNSNPNTEFVVEFFANDVCDPSGNGEGKTFIGRATVRTTSNCTTDFDVSLPVSRNAGTIISATATNLSNNSTSEFSACALAKAKPSDFDGDGRADQAVFRPSDRIWYLLRSQLGFTALQFGISTDKLAPADYDGDGKTDIAVFRDGIWYWLNSSNSSFNTVQFGLAGDIPLPFDYSGDGRAELAVYRNGIWYMLNLSSNQFQAVQFGIASDKPVPADFDGDGRIDFAVYRDGIWYMLRSRFGFGAVQFGIASDKPVVGDYDGDGRADQAVYRSGVWYVLRSTQGFHGVQFGISSDIPVVADYDGDGKTDVAVFRDGIWYLLRSGQGFDTVQFGITNDPPIPAAFVP